MDRRQFLHSCLTAGTTLALADITGCASTSRDDRQSGILERIGVPAIDTHAHPEHILSNRNPDPTMPTIGMMQRIGLGASAFAAVGDWVRYPGRSGLAFGNTQDQLGKVLAHEDSKQVRVIRAADDLRSIGSSGRIPAALLAIEGGDALQGDLANLDRFFDTGVRILTVMHDHNNEIGVNQRAQTDGPLTAFGIQVIERMNRLGMVVDVAHAKTQTLRGIVEVTAAPVIDSHTSLLPSGSNPSRPTRLRTWAEMELVAKTGGVVCTWPFAYAPQRTTLRHWAEEIREIKARLGIAHCGLGTDGGGSLPRTVDGWQSIASLPALMLAMRDAGLSDSDVAAYLGGNVLRVMHAVIQS